MCSCLAQGILVLSLSMCSPLSPRLIQPFVKMPLSDPHADWMLHGPGPHSRSDLLAAGLSTAAQASHMLKQAAERFEAAGGADTAAEAAREASKKADTAAQS